MSSGAAIVVGVGLVGGALYLASRAAATAGPGGSGCSAALAADPILGITCLAGNTEIGKQLAGLAGKSVGMVVKGVGSVAKTAVCLGGLLCGGDDDDGPEARDHRGKVYVPLAEREGRWTQDGWVGQRPDLGGEMSSRTRGLLVAGGAAAAAGFLVWATS